MALDEKPEATLNVAAGDGVKGAGEPVVEIRYCHVTGGF